MSVATTIGRDVLNLPCRYEGAGGGLEQAAYISGHQDARLAAYRVVRDSPALAKLETDGAALLAAVKAIVMACDHGNPSTFIADLSAAKDLCVAAVAADEGE